MCGFWTYRRSRRRFKRNVGNHGRREADRAGHDRSCIRVKARSSACDSVGRIAVDGGQSRKEEKRVSTSIQAMV